MNRTLFSPPALFEGAPRSVRWEMGGMGIRNTAKGRGWEEKRRGGDRRDEVQGWVIQEQPVGVESKDRHRKLNGGGYE